MADIDFHFNQVYASNQTTYLLKAPDRVIPQALKQHYARIQTYYEQADRHELFYLNCLETTFYRAAVGKRQRRFWLISRVMGFSPGQVQWVTYLLSHGEYTTFLHSRRKLEFLDRREQSTTQPLGRRKA